MSENNYWAAVTKARVGRRRWLRGTLATGVGAAALSFIGCGGGSDNTAPKTAENAGSLVSKPVDTTKQAQRVGVLPAMLNADAAGFNAYPHTALTVSSANDLAYSK